jgi:ADP-ribose pyrophosphatase YjhB (NUDIX family)
MRPREESQMPNSPERPREAASVAIVGGERVLLIQRAYAPYQHLWTLPGGRRESGESVAECAIREVAEELQLRIDNLRPVLVQRLTEGAGWQLSVFATATFAGDIRPSDEIADLRWCTPAESEAMRTTAGLSAILRQALALVV